MKTRLIHGKLSPKGYANHELKFAKANKSATTIETDEGVEYRQLWFECEAITQSISIKGKERASRITITTNNPETGVGVNLDDDIV